MTGRVVLAVIVVVIVGVAVWDLVQTRHAILRNFPVVGHFRYMLEKIGPELRQYIVTDNDEERPFSRDQRSWVYRSSKRKNNYFGFGTDNRLNSPQYPLIRQAAFPHQPGPHEEHHEDDYLPCAKVVGEWRDRPRAFRPQSMVNVSAMSFGSLSSAAVVALNRGANLAGCLHNTGEGGISRYHDHGGELVFQLGTGYFGARASDGSFDLDRLLESIDGQPVRAIEIKLSQGAKPGLGGLLPAQKVTPEIAEARGVPVGVTVASPATHSAFGSVPTMIDFVERIAAATGLPVGIKSAVGEAAFWRELADQMNESGRGPDFITIDGGEGGTGAAPLAFSDHVALPFRLGFAEVFRTFADRGLHDKVVWVGGGRLGFPVEALLATTLGVDLIAVAREAMLAVGCIQAQKCHNGHCPTGVATQNRRLVRGLDPTDKSIRLAGYVSTLRHEILQLSRACGQPHPSLVSGEQIDVLVDGDRVESVWDHFGYDPAWFSGRAAQRDALIELCG